MGISFRQFMQDDMAEEKDDIARLLEKIPPRHAALVKDYKWKFHPGNTLNGDDQHVGYMDDSDKEIAVAGPWKYPREFTVLHEIGHRVWENLIPPEIKQKWAQLASRAKKNNTEQNPNNENNPSEEDPEEFFCMVYATCYATHPPITYYYKDLMNFVKQLA